MKFKTISILLCLIITVNAQTFLIITHKDSKVRNINVNALKAVFKGEQTILGSRKIKLTYWHTHQSEFFYKKIFGKSANNMSIANYWGKKELKPKIFTNSKDLYVYMLNNRNAITFIEEKELGKYNSQSVNILTINGVNSNHAKYYLSSK